jgi:hypothetical protein
MSAGGFSHSPTLFSWPLVNLVDYTSSPSCMLVLFWPHFWLSSTCSVSTHYDTSASEWMKPRNLLDMHLRVSPIVKGPSHGPPRHGNRDPATERTPLIPRAEEIIAPKHYGEGDLSLIWILEFLLAVPFPVILLVQMLLAETAALSTTVVDGSSAFMGE